MKKIGSFIGKIFRHIGLFFDKWLITPITKLILRLMDLGKKFVQSFDKISSKKSSLIIISLVLSLLVFIYEFIYSLLKSDNSGLALEVNV